MPGHWRAMALVRAVSLFCAAVSVAATYTCQAYSDGCTETAAANYALDCISDDPTTNADDRDYRTLYLTGSNVTFDITSCNWMYTYDSGGTVAIDPYAPSSMATSSGVTVTVWGAGRMHVYKPGGVPPRGARIQLH